MNNKMIKNFYPVVFEIERTTYHTLWYTDKTDGFLLNEKGGIQFFTNKKELEKFAKNKSYNLDDEILQITSNIFMELETPNLDCNLTLTYWNIFSDVAKSTGSDFLGDSSDVKIQDIYDKLFYGCNLPTFKKNENNFFPHWQEDEIQLIKKVLKSGFEIFHNSLLDR